MIPDPSTITPTTILTPKGHLPGTFGRPSIYDPKYCDLVIAWFNQPASHPVIKTTITKSGNTITEIVNEAIELPTMEGFANSINTSVKVLRDWCNEYPDFSFSYTQAQAYQKQILIQNGTMGRYQPQFTTFVAKNCTDMRDVQEVQHTASPGLQALSDSMQEAMQRLSGSVIDITPVPELSTGRTNLPVRANSE